MHDVDVFSKYCSVKKENILQRRAASDLVAESYVMLVLAHFNYGWLFKKSRAIVCQHNHDEEYQMGKGGELYTYYINLTFHEAVLFLSREVINSPSFRRQYYCAEILIDNRLMKFLGYHLFHKDILLNKTNSTTLQLCLHECFGLLEQFVWTSANIVLIIF